MERYIIEFAASFLIYFLYFGLILLWFVDGKVKKEQVLHALLATFFAFILSQIFKRIFHTERPYLLDNMPVLTLTLPHDAAFPSSHTAQAFAIATSLWLHDHKVGWLFLVLALIIGISRVLANVHFPLDIFGGAVLGVVIAFLTDKLHLQRVLKRK